MQQIQWWPFFGRDPKVTAILPDTATSPLLWRLPFSTHPPPPCCATSFFGCCFFLYLWWQSAVSLKRYVAMICPFCTQALRKMHISNLSNWSFPVPLGPYSLSAPHTEGKARRLIIPGCSIAHTYWDRTVYLGLRRPNQRCQPEVTDLPRGCSPMTSSE